MNNNINNTGLITIRNIYLYLVALIGLVVFVMGAVGFVDTVFKTYVFEVDDSYYFDPYSYSYGDFCNQYKVDPSDPDGYRMIPPSDDDVKKCELELELQREKSIKNNSGRQFSISFSQILIGLPLWIYHWKLIQRKYRRKKTYEEIS